MNDEEFLNEVRQSVGWTLDPTRLANAITAYIDSRLAKEAEPTACKVVEYK